MFIIIATLEPFGMSGIGCSTLTLMNYWKLVLGAEGTKSDILEPGSDGLLRMISWASGLGFDSMELWVSSDNHLSSLTGRGLGAVRRACKVSNISADYLSCDFTAGRFLTRPDGQLEKLFERIAKLARFLEVRTVASISPPLSSAVVRWSHVYHGAPPEEVKLEPAFSWEKNWSKYVERISRVVKILGRQSLNLAVEPRAKEILSSTDSVLRLVEQVGAENLGGLIDTSHLRIINEVPSISIHKLGKKLLEFHASENDGITAYHWAPGQGEVDWKETLSALKQVRFDGPVLIDVTGINMDKEVLDGKRYLDKLMVDLELPPRMHLN